jgi:hypothetical protein
MRNLLSASLVIYAVGVSACTSKNPSVADAQPDLGGSANAKNDAPSPDLPDLPPPSPVGLDLGGGDLASNAGDLARNAPAGQTGCHGYAACYGACNTTSMTQQQYDTCSTACDTNASVDASNALNAAFDCGVMACMAAGRCASLSDYSDPCVYCVYDAISALFALPCNGDPMCNTSVCTTQVTACLASLP